jgi:hypothetical protein
MAYFQWEVLADGWVEGCNSEEVIRMQVSWRDGDMKSTRWLAGETGRTGVRS